MGGHISKLGTRLNSAVQSYNDTVASLETRVFTTARRLVDLKVTSDELEPPRPIELVTRKVQKSELVASANETLVSMPAKLPEPLFGELLSGDAEPSEHNETADPAWLDPTQLDPSRPQRPRYDPAERRGLA